MTTTKTRNTQHHDEALTSRTVQSLTTPGKYPDGQGLFLQVLPSGMKSWRYRYRIAGREGLAVLGTFPSMTLAQARVERDSARAEVVAGRHPVERKRAAQEAAAPGKPAAPTGPTLGEIAEQWFKAAKAEPGTWTDSHADKTRGRIDNHIKPTGLWSTPIGEVRVAALAEVLDALHAKAPDTANKVRQILSGVFRYAAARGLVESDPVAVTQPGSGQRKKRGNRQGNLPAVTDQAAVNTILHRIEHSKASWQVRGALRLMAYTAQRPGRVVAARWSEFQLEGERPTWTIAREDQKNKTAERPDHVVPLVPSMVAWLRTLPRAGDCLFPGDKKGHMSLDAPAKFLRTSLSLAGTHTPHGFRSSFSTLANAANAEDGSRRFDRNDIEHILDHEIPSETVRAYDRLRALPRLQAILQWWADQLDAR